MPAEDAHIIAALRAGDDQVATAFYEKYNAKLFRMMYFSAACETDAEELTRQTFVAFFESLPRFRGASRLSTFLYGIAKNVLRNYYARRRRAPTVSLDDAAAAHEIRAYLEGGATGLDGRRLGPEPPEDLVARAETTAVVRDVLARLKPAYRDVLILRYANGMPGPAVAALLGKTAAATRVLTHRAAQAFTRELGRLEGRLGERLVER